MMKNFLLLIFALSLVFQLTAQDKKAIMKLEKKYHTASQGKALAGAEDVAIVGANVRFKLASREKGETSNKADTWTVFGAYGVLDGVGDEVFQEIANEYEQMIIKRFESMGIKTRPYEDITALKSFAKLKSKGLREKDNVKKSWGVARIFTPHNRDYINWNYASPLGPHSKVAKELKSLMFGSMVTVDFCMMGVEVSQTSGMERGSGRKTTYTEGSSSVVPVILIDGYTYPLKGLLMGEDNSISMGINSKGHFLHTRLDFNPSEIYSDIDYAVSTEKCDGCTPEFAQGRLKIMEHTMGTVVIKADPDLYKKAVLDALGKYLDEMFTLLATVK